MPNMAVKMAFAGDASDRACGGEARDGIDRFTPPSSGDSMQTASGEPLSGPSEMIVANYYASPKFRRCISLVDTPTTTLVAAEVKTETPPVAAARSAGRNGRAARQPSDDFEDPHRDAFPVQCRTPRCGLLRTTSRVRPGASFDRDASEFGKRPN